MRHQLRGSLRPTLEKDAMLLGRKGHSCPPSSMRGRETAALFLGHARPLLGVSLLIGAGIFGSAAAVAAAPQLSQPASAGPAASAPAGAEPASPAVTSASPLSPASASGAPGSPASAVASQVDANGQLDDPVLQTRFESIAKDLRCLVCQNESIADSNAQLASDLRRQVREMLVAGSSDAQIFQFMTDRYGDFVRFNPPLEAKTLLIWGAPFIMLLLGAAIIVRVTRHRSSLPLDDEPAPGSP